MRAARAPSKITAPEIPRAYRRQRLFDALDEARRSASLTWIAAPAGAGKTTLVVSYAASRKVDCLWYELDPGDAELASFFHYLGRAVAQAAPRFRQPLPRLTPEYLDAGAFARNFFREVGRRLRPPFVLVLDNAQELAGAERFYEVLKEGLKELPRGGHVLLVSRAEPPEQLARLRVNRQMAELGWRDLRLTKEELPELVRLLQPQKGGAPEELHRRCDGWIAGLILMLQVPGSADEALAPASQKLFDFFAAEVFARRPPAVREFLMCTALFPSFTAEMAQRLTGYEGSRGLLDGLVREHLFTERRSESSESYQYHALFREFLLEQARGRFPAAQWRILQRAATAILVEAGAEEAAAELMRESADHEALESLILRHAGPYVASGRLGALAQWLQALPPERLAAQPWLAYWMGVCRMPLDLPAAREHFERAYAGFAAQGAADGQYLALAAILDSFSYQWDDFAPVRGWIEELDRLESRHRLPESPAVGSIVVAAALGAACFGYPRYPRLAAWAARAEALLAGYPDVEGSALVASKLAMYYGWLGNFASLRALVDPMRRLLQARGAAPLGRLYAYFILAQSSWLLGAPQEAERYAEQGLAEAERSGVRVLDSFLLGISCFARGLSGDTARVREGLERMHTLLQPGRRLDFAHYHYERARAALLGGDHPAALAHADVALKSTRALACEFPATLCAMAKAEALCALGRFDEADALAAEVAGFARGFGSRLFEFEHGLMKAWVALGRGERAACRAALAPALAIGREQHYLSCYSWSPAMMTGLCVLALEEGLEPEYVRGLVRVRGLSPAEPPLHLDAWPWKIEVHALGAFRVRVDGEPLRFSVKAQKRPLDLLKALVALGGAAVREDSLAEILWPQAEADSAALALTSTLHRLRKLLGEAAIVRRDGRLSLSPKHCWIDLWALERQLALLERASRGAPDPALGELAERVFALYRGAFLADHRDEPWVLSTRERLRSKFLRAMGLASKALRDAGQHEQAIHCLEKALEVDPLVESFYRGIMQVELSRGQHAAALAAYHRCRKVLAAELALPPSADTEALRRQIPSA